MDITSKKDFKDLTWDELCVLIASGDAEAMFQTAVCVYSGYATFSENILKNDNDEIFRMMDMAAFYGDGSMNRKVGDFFRFEYQERRAKIYYQQAFLKDIEKAINGDAEAQFALCEHYVTGYGVPNDMESAGFWCMMAAKNGYEEAIKMMPNFWRLGIGLPACEEIAKAWESSGEHTANRNTARPEIKELRESVLIQKSINDYEKIGKELGKRPQYSIKSLVKGSVANTKSALSRFIEKLSHFLYILYIISSAIGYTITSFCGYHESGIVNLANRIFYRFLVFPTSVAKIFSADISMIDFCNGFGRYTLSGAGIGKSIKLILSFIWNTIPCILVWGIWFLLVGLAMVFIVAIIKGMLFGSNKKSALSISADKSLDFGTLPPWLETQRSKARIACAYMNECDIPAEYNSELYLLALCELADFYKTDLTGAQQKFRMLAEASPAGIRKFTPRLGNSTVALRFLLLRLLPQKLLAAEGSNGDPVFFTDICYSSTHGIENNSTLIQAYREYRCGRNYKQAEDLFRSVMTHSPGSIDAGWAAWFLSKIYRSERLCGTKDRYQDTMHDEKCLKEASEFEKIAERNGCPPALMTETALAEGMFRLDVDIKYFPRDMIDSDFEDTQYYFYYIEEYFQDLARAEKQRKHECGYHFNEETWNGYETKCLWAKLNKLEEEGLEHTVKKYLTMSGIGDAGLYRAEYLAQYMQERLDASIYHSEAMMRQNQAVELEISRELHKYEDALDDRERTINLLLSDSFLTHEERYLRNEISASEYIHHDYFRRNRVDKYHDELVREYEQKHNSQDN